jgi:hypothetical protein
VKKLAALLLIFGCVLSLSAQDRAHRFVEAGFDLSGSFANSYLRTGDVFKERIFLDITKMAGELGNGLGALFDAHGEVFVNFNLGATWGFGFFAGLDAIGQFKIPQSLIELISEGNRLDKTYSENLGLGAAAFLETGFWASAKIRRIKFTVRPALFLPLAYLNKPRVNYTFAPEDNGTFKVAGNYNVEMYAPIPLDDIGAIFSRPGDIDIADLIGKSGVDLVLRAEYPVYHNFTIGGSVGHIPLFRAQLADKYSMSGGFAIEKTLDDIINNDFDIGDIEQDSGFGTDQKAIFRPFAIGADAVYRPFNIRLLTVKPELALVFNSVYDTPVYVNFGVTGELHLADIFTLAVGTRFEDLVWKERFGFTLNLRILELKVGITTQSQKFIRSFQGAGFAVDVGLRLGF